MEFYKILIPVFATSLISGIIALVGMYHKQRNLTIKVEKLESESKEDRRMMWDKVNTLDNERHAINATLEAIQGFMKEIKERLERIENKFFNMGA